MMSLRFSLFFVLLNLIASQASGGLKVKSVSAEITYHAPASMSIEEAKLAAIEQAKIQAIADEFGTVVSQSSSLVIASGDESFNSTSESDVLGEWLETSGEPKLDIQFIDDMLVIKVDIKGKARERSIAQADFSARLLRNGTDVQNESAQFCNGDGLFLYFRSPSKGYLTAYLLDHKTGECYCLLPYHNSDGQAVEVKQDKDYVFFSPEHAESSVRNMVDEYTMTCGDERELNEVYVVFSPIQFSKPGTHSESDRIPPQLSLKDFHKWLSKARTRDEKLSCLKLPLSVSPRQ